MDIAIRATIVFFMLFAVLRLMGKRQLGQMTPFEFVALVVLGDFVQQAVTHNDFSITAAALAVVTFAFWSLILGWLSYYSDTARKILEGEPRVIIRDGRIDHKMLNRDKISAAEMLSEMRLAGIARLTDVEWAILEPSGKVSFIERKKTGAKVEPAERSSSAV